MDRSSSMNDDSDGTSCAGGCGANSKWSLLSTAVDDLVALYPRIIWGLAFYASDDACGTDVGPVIPLGPDQAGSIAAALGAATLGGEAPTGDAITSAVADLQVVNDGHAKYILLVSDGHSGCAGDAGTAEAAVSIAGAQNGNGIPTFVLGPTPGADTAANTALDQMAQSASEAAPAVGRSYYTPTDIVPAFRPVAGCVLSLTGVPVGLTNVAVAFTLADGSLVEVPEDPTNGWTYTDTSMTAIVLAGTYCTELNDGTATSATLYYACTGPDPIIDRTDVRAARWRASQ
jgi:hypothetical protein